MRPYFKMKGERRDRETSQRQSPGSVYVRPHVQCPLPGAIKKENSVYGWLVWCLGTCGKNIMWREPEGGREREKGGVLILPSILSLCPRL